MIKIKSKPITQENFKKFGKVVISPTTEPTAQAADYKFWSDLAHYIINGETEIDWMRLITTLQEHGYDDVLSIEHEDPVWEGSEEKVKAGLVLGYKHLSQFVL
jgi:sugar phosphate isomerase/epimerase